ncbi:MAG TPA: hypothetical protein VMM56_13720, partial [Planctomycetaceae bacterium]|nr:hypothetical protein [Planctomycetaceae bacterium]
MSFCRIIIAILSLQFVGGVAGELQAEELKLTLRTRPIAIRIDDAAATLDREETWNAEETAIIVCDVWDLHHSLNAVRRVEQFAPRLDAVLKEARKWGVTIVHSPSDCMDSYSDHPARRRAVKAPVSPRLPHDIRSWCSVIPAEERAAYPIDQSDGGDDDDPAEHAEWVAKLEKLGRNPGTPWKSQSDLIAIDSERDYISDRGDEVWNVLDCRGIRNVILTGVHVNMCVLGRPFGLRQMARNGKNVVLMRDMTDTMYNPKSWPYVSHFEGTARIIAHIERFVCPTITSDQIIGGKPFRFRGDDTSSETKDRTGRIASETVLKDFQTRWVTIDVPSTWKTASKGVLNGYRGPGWSRCVVKIPGEWSERDQLELSLDQPVEGERVKAWINGHALQPASNKSLAIPSKQVNPDDHNLIVIRVENDSNQLLKPPVLKVLQTDSE